MRKVVCDIETNGLKGCDKLWIIVAKDVDTDEEFTFVRPDKDPQPFVSFMSEVDTWIGHNFLTFDAPTIERLVSGAVFEYDKIIDTLIISRLIHYEMQGRHSLDNWGRKLGFPKTEFSDWDYYSLAMKDYCVNDVRLNLAVYKYLLRWINQPDFELPIRVEHQIALVCMGMHNDGFPFDMPKAKEYYKEVLAKLEELDAIIAESFPPKVTSNVDYVVRAKKDGTPSKVGLPRGHDITGLNVGDTFNVTKTEPFNPGSPLQVVTALNEFGWKPIEKTKGHLAHLREREPVTNTIAHKQWKDKKDYYAEFGWKVSEANLATLPDDAPEGAKVLSDWLMYDSRRSKFEEWFNAYCEDTGCIHGNINHIGAWTHRMSHSAPNMANILSEHGRDGSIQYLGKEMRQLWTTTNQSKDSFILGTDASSIQLRILAHYLESEEYAKAVSEGNSDDGTDVHTLNAKLLGPACKGRPPAKTFIYAWLLGAGTGKVAEILQCAQRIAKESVDKFIEETPGLKRLKTEIIPADTERCYFVGLDGRKVVCNSEYLMLAGYLQNGESVVMKHANLLWRREFDVLGVQYKQRNFIHDEWQTEIFGCTEEEVLELGKIQANAIKTTGENLGVRCPLDGESKIGYTWYETH